MHPCKRQKIQKYKQHESIHNETLNKAVGEKLQKKIHWQGNMRSQAAVSMRFVLCVLTIVLCVR